MTNTFSSDFSRNTALYWIWLSLCCYPGSGASDLILEHFGQDPRAVYDADREEFEKIDGLPREVLDRLCCKHSGKAEEIRAYCMRHGIGILTPDNPVFPERLRVIRRRPLLFYYRGTLPDFTHRLYVATVGTRSFSEYGRREGYNIAYDLARAGAVVVSGMAKGIDSVCHRAALDAGGSTVAVLGCGIDRCYPPENRALMEEIAAKGLLLTEYPPFTAPVGSHFPVRNRIISGLSQATFVVEGSQQSGALITARLAEEQGRTVFALPGQVGELESYGTNALIQENALPVTCAMDILEEFAGFFPETLHPDRIQLDAAGFSGGRPSKAGKLPFTVSMTEGDNGTDPGGKELRDGKKKDVGDKKRPTLPPRDEIPALREEPRVLPDGVFPDSVSSVSSVSAVPAVSSVSPVPQKATAAVSRKAPSAGRYSPDSPEGVLLRRLREGGEMTADQLAGNEISVHQVLSLLTLLEMEGAIHSLPGGKFSVGEA